ncbi:MAG TPA: polysaccharide deacetylase family protein [Acidimicrobiia bacterium]|nr:polysaccharide deacetylase family protein [Acidimicrobiia bacterium]
MPGRPTRFVLPNGKRMAVLFNVAYEGWESGAAPGIGPMGNPLPAGVFDTQAASWGAYGYQQGIWRLIDVFTRSRVRATVFASACLAERAADTLRALRDGGHEIAAHGYSQHRIPALLDPDEEARDVSRCVELLSDVTGEQPHGWLSPRGTPSSHTARLVTEQGMEWFGDVYDTDVPYALATPAGTIVALPFKMEVNDLPSHMRHGNPPRTFLEVFDDTFQAMYEREGDGCYLDVTVHAHVFGRPHGAWTVEAIARRLAEHPDVWIPTRLELARWTTQSEAADDR